MSIKTSEEYEALRRAGRVVARIMQAMADRLRPGVTTGELDELAVAMLAHEGARSAPRLCVGFPGATCISINEEAAHGVPGDRVVQAGDIVNLDVSAELDGYFVDMGASYPVSPVSPRVMNLCRSTRRAFRRSLSGVAVGRPLNLIGRTVEREARRSGFKAIRNLCSHGVGRWLHEEPQQIQNCYDPKDRRRFSEGLVVALETFLSEKSSWVVPAEDGWTLRTVDNSLAAQYEHTVVVTRKGPVIVTRP